MKKGRKDRKKTEHTTVPSFLRMRRTRTPSVPGQRAITDVKSWRHSSAVIWAGHKMPRSAFYTATSLQGAQTNRQALDAFSGCRTIWVYRA